MKRVLFRSEPIVYLRQNAGQQRKVKMVLRATVDTAETNPVSIEAAPYGVSKYTNLDKIYTVSTPVNLLALSQTISSLPKLDMLDENVVRTGYNMYHELECRFIKEDSEWVVGADCDGEFLTAPMPEPILFGLEDALITCLDSGVELDWRWFAKLLLGGRVLSQRIYDALCGKFIDHSVPRRIVNELIPSLPECGIDVKLVRPTAAAIKLADSTVNAVTLAAYHLSENIIEAISAQSDNPVVMDTLRDWQARVVHQTGENDFSTLNQRHLELYSITFPYCLRADIPALIKKWEEKSRNEERAVRNQATTSSNSLDSDSVMERACSLQKWLAEHISTLPTKAERNRATAVGVQLTNRIEDARSALKSGRQQKRFRAICRLQDFCDTIDERLIVIDSTKNGDTPHESSSIELTSLESVDPLPESDLTPLLMEHKGAPDSRVLRTVLLYGFVHKKVVGMQYTDVRSIADRISGKGVTKGEVVDCAEWLLNHGILESHHPERGLIASLSIKENVKRPEPGDAIVAMVRRALYLTNGR